MAVFEGETGLSLQAAREEATRCLFCYDAPCVAACPTGIDVPGFIHAIATGNLDGSARTILAANPLGGTCARVCPVESLCEGACVRVPLDGPVKIGALQRVAMDAYRDAGRPFFVPGEPVGKRVAVVGAGPAGLACAAELRRHGHRRHDLRGAREGRRARCVRHRPVAACARHDRPRGGRGRACRRRDLARHAGGRGRGGRRRRPAPPARRRRSFSRSTTPCSSRSGWAEPPLGVPGEGLDGVVDALTLLEPVVTGEADLDGDGANPVRGRRVGVVGGGSTAMDAAAAAVQLGADEVTVFYRRGEAEAPAYPHAVELARSLGVRFHWLVAPVEITGADGRVTGAVFDTMRLGEPDASGRAAPEVIPGARLSVELDAIVVATGQESLERLVDEFDVSVRGGRVIVDPATGRTSNPRVWAGGDVVNGGREVVNAVQDGKVAAASIAASLGVATAPARVEISRRAGSGSSSRRQPGRRAWPAFAAPTRSGWPAHRPRTPARWSPGPSRRAGAAPSGRPSATRSRT